MWNMCPSEFKYTAKRWAPCLVLGIGGKNYFSVPVEYQGLHLTRLFLRILPVWAGPWTWWIYLLTAFGHLCPCCI